jgi:hypothetical protein
MEQQGNSFDRNLDPPIEVIGDASPVRSEQIPPGYSLHSRMVRLLSGNSAGAFYSTHIDQVVDPRGLEQLRDALVAGFVWALQVSEFADHETTDDDRAQEIGNMMSFALSYGLAEEQLVQCYVTAFEIASSV